MRVLLFVLVGILLVSGSVLAENEPVQILVIDHQQFAPNKLIIASGIKTRIVIRNQDAMPTEFESYELSREIVVPGHGEATIYVGPLEPGSYQFFNDFNHDMQGVVVVNAAPPGGK
jgi:hypothetical protein